MRKPNNISAIYTQMIKSKGFKALTREEETALFVAARAGNLRARERLICANVRFAAQVARSYQHKGMEFDDLFEEAVLGLCRAVDRFDHSRGFKFITYAVWWVRQGILLALANQGRVMNLPPSILLDMGKIEASRARQEQKAARAPTLAQVAAGARLSEARVVEAMAAFHLNVSMESRLPGNDDGALEEVLADDGARTDEEAVRQMNARYLVKLMNELEPAQRTIVRMHFGLDSGEGFTLDEVGQCMSLTRERIRQIKEKTLIRLGYRMKALEIQVARKTP